MGSIIKKMSSMLRKSSKGKVPKEDDLSKNSEKKDAIIVTKVYHSCFLIKYKDGTTILTDPYFNNETKGNLKIENKNNTKKESLPKIDLILVSHEHFDHFDKDAVDFFVKRDKCIVVAPNYVTKELDLDKSHKRTIKVDDKLIVATVKISVVPAQHPQSFYPVGYILEKDNKTIYFAGDTISLPLITKKIDLAIMPAGGIFTSDPFKFISMARQLKCETAIPMHYNTFDIIKINTDKMKDRCEEKLKTCKLVILGDNDKFYLK